MAREGRDQPSVRLDAEMMGPDTLLWLIASLDNHSHLVSQYSLKASAIAKSFSYGR